MLLFLMSFFSFLLYSDPPVTLTITNFNTYEGNVRVGLYRADNVFPKEEDTYKNIVVKAPQKGKLTVEIPDLPEGKYAIALYQDKNKNAKLDRNFFGIPKEGFAFSNNIQPNFKAPNFEECAFEYKGKPLKLNLALIHF